MDLQQAEDYWPSLWALLPKIIFDDFELFCTHDRLVKVMELKIGGVLDLNQ